MQGEQTKKWYQKWWIWVIGLIFIVIAWNRIGNFINDAMTKDIPNVMGIAYADAEKVLKEQGFRVTAVETDASSVLAQDTFNRSVKAGDVFKINNETNPIYTYGETKNKKVTIYYAKEDYTCAESEKDTEKEVSAAVVDSKPAAAPAAQTKEPPEGTEAWRQFLKDYEEWTNQYIEFAKKCKANPSDTKLIAEYAKLAGETVKWAEKAQAYEDQLRDEDVSSEIITEYINTLARITQKLAEAAAY